MLTSPPSLRASSFHESEACGVGPELRILGLGRRSHLEYLLYIRTSHSHALCLKPGDDSLGTGVMGHHPDPSCRLPSGFQKAVGLNFLSRSTDDPIAPTPSPTSFQCLRLLRVPPPPPTQASLWAVPVHSFYPKARTLRQMLLRRRSRPTTVKAVPSALRPHHCIRRRLATILSTHSPPQSPSLPIPSLPLPAFLPASSASA